MEEPKQADYSVPVVIVALTAIVFVLDALTPVGIAIWALYVLPLGFTRWSSVKHLVFIVAGACTALISLGYIYSSPGASVEVVIMNRMLGV
jgi:cytochrome b subunit of formate dehydrogenase